MENTSDFLINNTLQTGGPTTNSSSLSGISDTFYISLFIIYIPGITTNVISIIQLCLENRKPRMPTNVLLLALCSVDLVAVCLACFWQTTRRLEMEMTFELCAVKSFFHPLMPLLTGSISMLMAIDRVLAFCTPFYYRTHLTKKTWVGFFAIVLLLLLALHMLPHLGLGSFWTETYRKGKVSFTCSVFTYQEEFSTKIFHILYVSVGFLLVVGIIICNAVVAGAVLLLRKRTIDSQKYNTNRQVPSRSTEIKFALIVGVLACVFVTCWLPYNVSRFVYLRQIDNIPLDIYEGGSGAFRYLGPQIRVIYFFFNCILLVL